MNIAKRYNLFVLEDDAQCFLGYYKGRIVGSIGHAASFSFQSSKHISSGEGGMIATSDEELANNIRRFGSLGYGAVGAGAGKGKISKETIQDPKYERHISMGWNYRMPELCAAVALGQIERLQELVNMRQKVAKLYSEAIAGCGWMISQSVPEGFVHSYWTYAVKLENNPQFNWVDFRNKYMELGGDGIYAAWQLTYLEPVFQRTSYHFSTLSPPIRRIQNFKLGLCPVAESLQPLLLQFKTNYLDIDVASQKVEALSKSISYFTR